MFRERNFIRIVIAFLIAFTVILAYMPSNVSASSKHEISAAKIKLKYERYLYDGDDCKPPVTVTYGGKKLKKGKDYKVSYHHYISPGESHVTVKGIGNYQGSVKKTYKIIVGSVKDLSGKYYRDESDLSKSYIKLTWKAPKKCSYYKVTVSKDGKGFGDGVYKVKATDFTLNDLGDTGKFRFSVTAYGGTFEKKASSSHSVSVYAGRKSQKITTDETSYTRKIGTDSFNLGAQAKTKLSYSCESSIVSVDSEGEVTINKPGTAEITIKAAESNEYDSATKTVKITIENLTTPTIKVTAKSCRRNVISWNKIKGAQGYTVTEVTTSKTFTASGGDKLTYSLTGRSAGKSYSYTVQAFTVVNGNTFTSDVSSSASCTTKSSTIGHAKSACGDYSAGDQSGGEVGTSSWTYSSSSDSWKHWGYVIRFSDESKAELLATYMEQACSNNNIGYDNSKNPDLETIMQKSNYSKSISKISTPCETDCNTLVAACINQIYKSRIVKTYGTWSKNVNSIVSTGDFKVYTDSKYVSSDRYLKRGDILMTNNKSHNHACVVL